MTDAQDLVERYVAVWNEPDPAARRHGIETLWVPDGLHYMGVREARGYDALEQRIVGSYEKNVRDAGYVFRALPNAQALRNVVTFNWQMIRPASEEVLATGLGFLDRSPDGRILCDYQFIVS